MPQVTNFSTEKVTLGRFELQPAFQEAFEHCPQAGEVLFLRAGVHYHVIQIDECVRQIEFAQTVLHLALKRGRGVAQAIRHMQELIHTHTSHCKSGVRARLLVHFDLPKPTL